MVSKLQCGLSNDCFVILGLHPVTSNNGELTSRKQNCFPCGGGLSLFNESATLRDGFKMSSRRPTNPWRSVSSRRLGEACKASS